MRIWALSDLHLSLGGDKPMDIFGEHWAEHHLRLAAHWDELVAPDDIVLSPGDFSWAGKPQEAEQDFQWLADRPGHKILIKGNHDHWWPKSKTKLASLLPEHTYALKKNACRIGRFGFFGCRGGDFAPLTKYGDQRSQETIDKALEKEKRELEASLTHLQQLEADDTTTGSIRICLFHYPPMPPMTTTSLFTDIISNSGATHCIYGHLHGADVGAARIEGSINGVDYRCTSCDQIDFRPVLIHEDGTDSH